MFSVVNIQFLCVKFVSSTNMLVERCALMYIFYGNHQEVRLLEHVC